MKAHARQERIMSQLLHHGAVRLVELCEQFQVSEGTIRNDLRMLELQGRLIRTHGGAVPIGAKHPAALKRTHGTGNDNANVTNADDALHHTEIQIIAHRAADLINEGDTILLTSSPITQAMVHDLLAMKPLVALTNSLDIAQRLSHNPAHTVILVGGRVQPNRDSLDGQMTANMLERIGMRVHKAFISCDGVNAAQGFACNDIDEARAKASMVTCADTVIMLAPSQVIGKPALMSFASLNQADHVITTTGVTPEGLNLLTGAGVRVSVCGEHLTELCADCLPQRRWRVGFANLADAQDFAVRVRQSFEQAAMASGRIELLLADNKADPQVALENARLMLEAKVDLMIEYQQDERTNYILMDLFRSAGVPVIAIDIPMPGAVYFGADNYRAGRIAGEAAANWIRQHWSGRLDRIVCLEQNESGSVPAARIQGSLVTLRAIFPLKESDILSYDTRGTLDESRSAALQALRNVPWGRNVLFLGINANSALGALEAAEALGRQSCTAVVSQNVTTQIRHELHRGNPMLIGAVDYFPGSYGERVLRIAEDMLTGKPVAPATYTDHLLVTSANVQQLYPIEGNGVRLVTDRAAAHSAMNGAHLKVPSREHGT